MNPFHVLELEDGADEREVKRAYARLLRQHRPGEDPTGFQRIHEAYQTCLDIARWQAGHPQEPAEDARVPPPVPVTGDTIAPAAHEAAPEIPAFNLDAVLGELVAAARDPSIDLQAWLSRHPDLYSIDNKIQVADAIVWYLHQAEPLPPPRLKILLHLFELDSVNQRFLRQEHAIEQLRMNSAQAHGDPDWSFVLDSKRPAARQAAPQRNVSWGWIFWAFIVLANLIRLAAS